jgi:hypothetical protein
MKLDSVALNRVYNYPSNRSEGAQYVPSLRATFNLCQPVGSGSYAKGQENATLNFQTQDSDLIVGLCQKYYQYAMTIFPPEQDAHLKDQQRSRLKFKVTVELIEE